MKAYLLATVALACLAGCSSTGYLVDAGGAGAGTVTVSWETPRLDRPALSPQHASQVAMRGCERQGYAYTEREVNINQLCAANSAAGDCTLWQVSSVYQCAGNHVAMPKLPPAMNWAMPR